MNDSVPIPLNVFGDDNFRLLDEALYEAKTVPSSALRKDSSNEIYYDSSTALACGGKSALAIKKSICRRLRWVAGKIFESRHENCTSKKVRNALLNKALRIACLADLIDGKMTKEELREVHGAAYAETTKETRHNPFVASSIESLQNQIGDICSEYSKKISDYTNRMFAERNKKIEELKKQIEGLKHLDS